jgi:hypothetical protein
MFILDKVAAHLQRNRCLEHFGIAETRRDFGTRLARLRHTYNGSTQAIHIANTYLIALIGFECTMINHCDVQRFTNNATRTHQYHAFIE